MTFLQGCVLSILLILNSCLAAAESRPEKLVEKLSHAFKRYELDRIPRQNRAWFTALDLEKTIPPLNEKVQDYFNSVGLTAPYFRRLTEMVFETENVAQISAISFLLSEPAAIQTVLEPFIRSDLKYTLLMLSFHPSPVVRANAFSGLAAYAAEDRIVLQRLQRAQRSTYNGDFGPQELTSYTAAINQFKQTLGFTEATWREKATLNLLKYETHFSIRAQSIPSTDPVDRQLELQAQLAIGEAIVWAAGQRTFGDFYPAFELHEIPVIRYLTPSIAQQPQDLAESLKSIAVSTHPQELWSATPEQILALRSLALLQHDDYWLAGEIEKILPVNMPPPSKKSEWDYNEESLFIIAEALRWSNPNPEVFRNRIVNWVARIKSPELKSHVQMSIIPQIVFGSEASDIGCEVILLPNRL